MSKYATLTIQRWGNSLAVRIPAAIAKQAHFEIGTLIAVELQEVGIAVKPVGPRKLTLDERLKLFDPEKHGGEAMTTENIGVEKF